MINRRGWLTAFLLTCAILIVLMGVKARAADMPSIDCAVVRAYVAQHGKARALAWAIEQGYSWADIRRARQCLIEKPRQE